MKFVFIEGIDEGSKIRALIHFVREPFQSVGYMSSSGAVCVPSLHPFLNTGLPTSCLFKGL